MLKRIVIGVGSLGIACLLVFLALAVGGYTSLWLAIVADTGMSLVVIANGLRLLRTTSAVSSSRSRSASFRFTRASEPRIMDAM